MQLSHTAASSDTSGTVRPVTLCDNLGSHAVTPVTPGLCSDTCDTAGHPVTPHSGFPASPPGGPLPVPTLCLGTDPTGGCHPVPLGRGGTCHLQDICSLPNQPRAGCWEGGTGEGVLQGGDALGRGVRGDRGLQEGGRWGRGVGGSGRVQQEGVQRGCHCLSHAPGSRSSIDPAANLQQLNIWLARGRLAAPTAPAEPEPRGHGPAAAADAARSMAGLGAAGGRAQ